MGMPLKLLLVEDSEDDAELVVAEIMRGGFSPQWLRVDSLASLREALAAQPWDVIISDYHIYEFNAEHALGVVNDSGVDAPFIIVSGVVQAEQVVSLLKQGAHDFLNKDSLARLVPAIERELREAEQRTQRRRAEERVRILSLAIEQSPVSVVITDRNGIIGYVNPKFNDVTGYGFPEAMGRPLDFTRMPLEDDPSTASLWETIRKGQEWRGDLCNVRRDGQPFWEYATVSPLTDEEGRITNFVAVKEDITVRRKFEERLLRQANYDDLTGLPNRNLMFDRLELAIAIAQRNRTLTGLLYIDLDRFKTVNDAVGHGGGDHLLKEAARRLAACVRDCDTLARLGGDEFLIVLPSIVDRAAAQKVASRVLHAFANPFDIDGQRHFVTASVGVTLYPIDGTEAQTLVHNADLAMYKAKEHGRNTLHFFTRRIDEEVQERLSLESRLRGVVSRNELSLHYQPIIHLTSDRPVAYEALVRWTMADGRTCMPGVFIPVAEDIGLIPEIGDWVLATATAEAGSLIGDEPGARIAVNVSPRQLRVGGFGAAVARMLANAGLAPDRLELEITERVLMDETAETTANLQSLCDLGVRLSIDDFGTGYSSLGYLQKYPFSTLKIDRSFVWAAVHNPSAARLVETIITMAHGLEMDVIAEGVETEAQLEFLRSRNCNHAQGFLFSRPAPAAAFRTPERVAAAPAG